MIETRQKIERAIAVKVIDAALDSGYTVSVDDGEAVTVKESTDKEEILGAMFTTDEDYLYIHRPEGDKAFVRFVYGNDGYDVIADNSCSLEEMLKPATELADKIEASEI